jgi:hypothetical protein
VIRRSRGNASLAKVIIAERAKNCQPPTIVAPTGRIYCLNRAAAGLQYERLVLCHSQEFEFAASAGGRQPPVETAKKAAWRPAANPKVWI